MAEEVAEAVELELLDELAVPSLVPIIDDGRQPAKGALVARHLGHDVRELARIRYGTALDRRDGALALRFRFQQVRHALERGHARL